MFPPYAGGADFRRRRSQVARGDWYGLTPAEIVETYGADAAMARFGDDTAFRPPDGESLDDVAARVRPARDEVRARACFAVTPPTQRATVARIVWRDATPDPSQKYARVDATAAS